MKPEIQLILGCLLLSGFVTYALWSSLRVWLLRQDLFTIRDDLWDAMKANGMLDIPAHRTFRNRINTIIRVAPFLSPLTVFRLFTIEVDHAVPETEGMPEQIVLARRRVVLRVARYLLLESFTGLVIATYVVSLMSKESAKEWIARIIQGIFDSPETRLLAKEAAKHRLVS